MFQSYHLCSVCIYIDGFYSQNETTKRKRRKKNEPDLEIFDATEHVYVSGGILLDDVLDVVRFERFLELASRHEVLDLAQRTDGALVSGRQLRQHFELLLVVFGRQRQNTLR